MLGKTSTKSIMPSGSYDIDQNDEQLVEDRAVSLAQNVLSIDSSEAPIGLFDSGVGGLSVYTHLKQVLPNESYIYYADLLNVPYGARSSEEITHLTVTAVDWLVAAGCKLIVIACNSASAHALDVIRSRYPDVPIVGLVPALKPAVLNSKSKNVAVLATKATLEGALLNDVIRDYAMPAKVNVIKCFNPNLVPWVESGMRVDSDAAHELKAQLHEFSRQQVDHLVLGCTHYPFFQEFIMEEVAAHNLGISIVDSGAAIASRVKEILSARQMFAKCSSQPSNTPVVSTHKSNRPLDQLYDDLYIGIVDSSDSLKVEGTNIETSKVIDDSKIRGKIPASAKLAFVTTSIKGDLAATSQMVNRLVGGQF